MPLTTDKGDKMVTVMPKRAGLNEVRVNVPEGYTFPKEVKAVEKKQPRRQWKVGDYIPSDTAEVA